MKTLCVCSWFVVTFLAQVSNDFSKVLHHISQKLLPCDSDEHAWLELGLGAIRQLFDLR